MGSIAAAASRSSWSGSSSPFNTRAMRPSSSSTSHLTTTMVATPLPPTFVRARISDMYRSTPNSRVSPARGTVPTACSVADSVMNPPPVTAAAPLELSIRIRSRKASCPGQVRVGGLRHENRGNRQINGSAVQVEGIARGDDQPDHRFRAAERLHLDHDAREHRFRRGGAQHDQKLFLNVLDEFPDAEAVQEGDESEDHEYECDTGDVDAYHQLGERDQRLQPVVAHRVRHRAERPDGRGLHDEADHAEHQVSYLV